jgi:hypothetical protein
MIMPLALSLRGSSKTDYAAVRRLAAAQPAELHA